MKKIIVVLLTLLMLGNFSCEQKPPVEEEEKVVALSDDERMAWWRDARFGMFIHWGAYAIPGGQRGDTICGGGAEWIMDKLDYTIEDYEKVLQKNTT